MGAREEETVANSEDVRVEVTAEAATVEATEEVHSAVGMVTVTVEVNWVARVGSEGGGVDRPHSLSFCLRKLWISASAWWSSKCPPG